MTNINQRIADIANASNEIELQWLVDAASAEVEEALENGTISFPIMINSTNDVVHSAEEYKARKFAEIAEEAAAVRATFDEANISDRTSKAIEVVFPLDMLWTDVDSANYLDDATETAYAEAVTRSLFSAGYEAKVAWSNVLTTVVYDEAGEVTDSRYDEIRSIIDSVEVDYIQDEE